MRTLKTTILPHKKKLLTDNKKLMTKVVQPSMIGLSMLLNMVFRQLLDGELFGACVLMYVGMNSCLCVQLRECLCMGLFCKCVGVLVLLQLMLDQFHIGFCFNMSWLDSPERHRLCTTFGFREVHVKDGAVLKKYAHALHFHGVALLRLLLGAVTVLDCFGFRSQGQAMRVDYT